MAKKCTKNYNAQAHVLCSFSLGTFPSPSWFLKLFCVNVKLSVFSVNKTVGIYFVHWSVTVPIQIVTTVVTLQVVYLGVSV